MTEHDISAPEMEQLVEDQMTGEIPDVMTDGEISEATGIVSELRQLRDVVIEEGVSQEDFEKLRSLTGRFNALTKGEFKTSLEDFPVNHFTVDRTMINQNVSVEHIGKTIITFILKLLKKISDWIFEGIRKYRRLMMNDMFIENAADKINGRLKSVYKAIATIEAELKRDEAYSLIKETNTYASDLFTGGDVIAATKIPLILIGDRKLENVIPALMKDATKLLDNVLDNTATIMACITTDMSPVHDYVDTSATASAINTRLLDLLEINPNPKQSYSKVDFEHEFTARLRYPRNKAIVSVNGMLDTITLISKNINKITTSRINADSTDDLTNQLLEEKIADLQNTAALIFDIMKALDEFKKQQIAYFKVQAKTAEYHYGKVAKYFTDTATSRVSEGFIDKVFAALTKELNRIS